MESFLGGVTEAALALAREGFAPALFHAAGFAGWCVLIDEVELIGRYAPLQRARAYAELARWLGLGDAPRIAGLRVAAAMRAVETAPVLRPSAEAGLLRHAETLRQGYASCYGWPAPSLPVGERRANRTMRHHIRGWITQWDVLRLQGRATALEVGVRPFPASLNQGAATLSRYRSRRPLHGS